MKIARKLMKIVRNPVRLFGTNHHSKIISTIPDLKEFMNQNKETDNHLIDINNIPDTCIYY
jgi:hypothetical protein